MKTLRLLFTPDCNRDCKGCCNKDWDLNALPKVRHFTFEEILITGGEPLLYPNELIGYIKAIRVVSDAKIYVYTAMTVINRTFKPIYDVIQHVDGITLTLHTQKDANDFAHVLYSMDNDPVVAKAFANKSLRLNVFKGIKLPEDFRSLKQWKIKKNLVWKKNCPLPENEIFMRI